MTLDLSNGFLEMTLKAKATKEKKVNCHQENLKLFCFKETQLKKIIIRLSTTKAPVIMVIEDVDKQYTSHTAGVSVKCSHFEKFWHFLNY